MCAPGNAGIAAVAQIEPVKPTDPYAVAALARQVEADLVVIGPEAPLMAGVADMVREEGVPVFGPDAAAARIEGSKSFAKAVMSAARVPTAESRTCDDPQQVEAALDLFGAPYVVKADGLAAGKGVVVTDDRAVALAHAEDCGRVVIEEYLDGPEVSLFVITDGSAAVPLLPAQDFKRIGDDDTGPNTGGMGAYTPLAWLPGGTIDQVMKDVVTPTLNDLASRGTPFVGVLYVGLAITTRGPRVIEFNARFGDPETQVVLAMLETPLAGLLNAAATGTLAAHPPLRWRDGAAVTVVMASAGYPGTPRTGDVITGADQPGVLHAATVRNDAGDLATSGGRVLSVTATGDDLAAARAGAYAKVEQITFEGAQYRSDIAAKAEAGEITLG
ncbi:phosphoribosylamine--glycine ligase [Cryptosporangium aurantiacum]|uniref:Phosphoribosylamine--glycine ligase n=1 Tax=Cryptosporangium aurantiacum TaxID=134849 RepID=A0A1M7RCZ3_9ACTN|nr:phosphoribosylamine--glycine ligase [Cryptosporangium aurantiacum]